MTTHILPMPTTSAPSRVLGLAGKAVLRFVDFVRAYRARRDLQMLAGFDDHMLRDIGLTRTDVHQIISGRSKVARSHE